MQGQSCLLGVRRPLRPLTPWSFSWAASLESWPTDAQSLGWALGARDETWGRSVALSDLRLLFGKWESGPPDLPSRCVCDAEIPARFSGGRRCGSS